MRSGVEGRGRGQGVVGEMAQIMYAPMINNLKKKKGYEIGMVHVL
jgi:hypothetical protein